MSNIEHHKGTLVPIPIKNTLEDTANNILINEFDLNNNSWYKNNDNSSSYLEILEDEGYRQYYITSDTIYKVQNMTDVDPESDIFISNKNDDNTINFEIKFYNGGCSFDEAIQYALENKNNE